MQNQPVAIMIVQRKDHNGPRYPRKGLGLQRSRAITFAQAMVSSKPAASEKRPSVCRLKKAGVVTNRIYPAVSRVDSTVPMCALVRRPSTLSFGKIKKLHLRLFNSSALVDNVGCLGDVYTVKGGARCQEDAKPVRKPQKQLPRYSGTSELPRPAKRLRPVRLHSGHRSNVAQRVHESRISIRRRGGEQSCLQDRHTVSFPKMTIWILHGYPGHFTEVSSAT